MELFGLILSLSPTTTTSGSTVYPCIQPPNLRVDCEQKVFQGSQANPDSRYTRAADPTTSIIHQPPAPNVAGPSSFLTQHTMALSRSSKIVFLLILDIIFFFVEIIVGP